ncbi:MAG: hypothetical protein HY595_04540 [Candidatus Omnitrophica bacterium]|nr:hypothetical protein [Candidatus Omnitrophota bacterium]
MTQQWFVARLTLPGWLAFIWPRLLWRRLRGGRVEGCQAVEHSPWGLRVAQVTGGWLGVQVAPLVFRLMDIRDERGVLVRLRLAYGDLADVQAQIVHSPRFREATHAAGVPKHLPSYLAKVLAIVDFAQHHTLWHTLLLVQVCRWEARRRTVERSGMLAGVFIERLPWMDVMARYAAEHQIMLAPIPRLVHPWDWLRRQLRPLRRWLQAVHGSWRRTRSVPADRAPRVATDSFGQLTLDHPELHSDLFFWQQSALPGRDVLVLFHSPHDPLDDRKLAQLREYDMDAVPLVPGATRLASRPAFLPRLTWPATPPQWRLRRQGGVEEAWLRACAADYQSVRRFWEQLFASSGVRVYLTWYRYDPAHCAIADALEAIGGVLAIYQRAHDACPSAETAVTADVFFCYSRSAAEIEQQSGSRVSSYVVTGYLGDHRAPLLQVQTRRIRERLQAHGAQRIMAFMDEGSLNHRWWFLDDQAQQEQHQFLLERVLAEPWFGLILKPKKPSTLRERLGPVARLLDQAEATGRCHVFEEGGGYGAYPPAAAALAADVAVHGHLFTGTAGMECALAGVPTLLLDREGWPLSPLYRLGEGRVVFTRLDILWRACLEQWRRPGGIPGFGDWSERLEELDPFRDGRAAFRLGTYVQWLLEGFKAGLNRQAVMAQASERYAVQWGSDKILAFDGSASLSGRDGLVPQDDEVHSVQVQRHV